MFRVLLISLFSCIFLFNANTAFAATAKHKTSIVSAVPDKYKTSDGKININTIDEDNLAKVKGVGAKRAASIMAYREAYGSFKSVDELKNVKLVGPKVFKKIKDEFSVG